MSKASELNKMIEAVLIAIPREIAACEFYTEMANKATDESSKEMFVFLAAQEKAHEEKLRSILTYLKTQLEYENFSKNGKS